MTKNQKAIRDLEGAKEVLLKRVRKLNKLLNCLNKIEELEENRLLFKK